MDYGTLFFLFFWGTTGFIYFVCKWIEKRQENCWFLPENKKGGKNHEVRLKKLKYKHYKSQVAFRDWMDRQDDWGNLKEFIIIMRRLMNNISEASFEILWESEMNGPEQDMTETTKLIRMSRMNTLTSLSYRLSKQKYGDRYVKLYLKLSGIELEHQENS